MSKIKEIKAREILDSRGNPTVEVDIFCDDGVWGRSSVPSGTSVGQYEALEIRDNDQARFKGLGVSRAVSNINKTISPKMIGLNVVDQRQIDETLIYLDNTPNKSNLGANAILGVSLASARAAANSTRIPLYKYLAKLAQTETTPYHIPIPFTVLLEGGKHGHDNIDFQEFMIVPVGATSFTEGIRWCSEVSKSLSDILKSQGQSVNFGDEGGFTPRLAKNIDGIELLNSAIKNAGFTPGRDISLALDVAASELFQDGKYRLAVERVEMNQAQMMEYYQKIIQQYPIFSIEDPFADTDWDSWTKLNQLSGKQLKIVGDDIFATNADLLSKGIKQNVANAIIIKPNQVGTLLETIQTVKLAQGAGYLTIVSHRSGETEDTFISDLSVAVNSFGLKTGGVNRSERTAKYNQLIRIEESLGSNGRYGIQLSV